MPCPWGPRAPAAQPRLRLVQVGGAVAPSVGDDAAYTGSITASVRASKNGRTAAWRSATSALVEQRGGLRQRRVVHRTRLPPQVNRIATAASNSARPARRPRRAARPARRSGTRPERCLGWRAARARTDPGSLMPMAADSTCAARPPSRAKMDTQSTLCAAGTTPWALTRPRWAWADDVVQAGFGTRPSRPCRCPARSPPGRWQPHTPSRAGAAADVAMRRSCWAPRRAASACR